MTVISIDHFTVRTRNLFETVEFFEQVAGLTIGARPPFPFDGRWLYQGDRPVVHLVMNDPSDTRLRGYLGNRKTAIHGGSGVVDHIAFRCKGLPEFEARLLTLGKAYRGRTVPEQKEHQLFVVDPTPLRETFHLTAEQMGLIWGPAFFGFTASAFVSAFIVDLIGVRRPYLLSGFGF